MHSLIVKGLRIFNFQKKIAGETKRLQPFKEGRPLCGLLFETMRKNIADKKAKQYLKGFIPNK